MIPILQAGFSRITINPPLGMPMEGLAQQGGCQSIHDDLSLRALFLTQGEERLLILACDLLFFERPQVAHFKDLLGQATGLTPAQIFLNTTHTHSGPRLTHWAYSGAPDPDYLDAIARAMVEVAQQAALRQQPVTVSAGMGETELPVSRRQPDAEGRAQWAPFRAGVVCRAVPFCLFKNQAGEVVSLLYSVSCHPSMIYSLDISADYPGVATRQLNQAFHTAGAIFLQGAGGDSKPRQIAVEEEYWRAGNWDDVEAAGTEVAEAVIAGAGRELLPITPSLRYALTPTTWPFAALPAEEELSHQLNDPENREGRRRWAADMRQQLLSAGSLPNTVSVELHAVQLGPELRLIGVEGELVGELGNLILAMFSSGVTFPLGYTNGAQIYLPSSRMLPEGGYEVDSFWEYHHPAKLAPGMETVLRSTVRALQADGIL